MRKRAYHTSGTSQAAAQQDAAGGNALQRFRPPVPFASRAVPAVQRQRVIQTNGWLKTLIDLVKNNPKTAAATTTVMALGGLYLYYRRRQQNQPQVEQAPDRSRLNDVARVLGIEPDALENHLENGALDDSGPVDFQRLIRQFPDYSNDNPITGIVPPSLTAGLNGTEAANVATIFGRLNNYNFRYNGNASSAPRGFIEKAGDCMTLVNMFIYATKAAGINTVTVADDEEKMLVTPRNIHGRNTVGNVAGQSYWFFHDHHWAVHQGQRYDLLFMSNVAPTVYHFTETREYNGVSFDVFEGNRCMLHAGEITDKRLRVDLGGMMGVTRDSISDMQEYIDARR